MEKNGIFILMKHFRESLDVTDLTSLRLSFHRSRLIKNGTKQKQQTKQHIIINGRIMTMIMRRNIIFCEMK